MKAAPNRPLIADRILVELQGNISVTGQKSRINRRDKSLSDKGEFRCESRIIAATTQKRALSRPLREREAFYDGSDKRC